MVKTIGKGLGRLGFNMLIGAVVSISAHYTRKFVLPFLDKKFGIEDEEDGTQPAQSQPRSGGGGAQARTGAYQPS